jgi:transposase
MFYLGIDIGKLHHAAALIDPRGKTVAVLSRFAATAHGFNQLTAFVHQHLPDKAELQVAMEATGPYWVTLDKWLTARGFQPVVLNPLKLSALRDYGVRGSKTDRIDAVLIAQGLRWEGCRAANPALSTVAAELRCLTRLRLQLVKERTRATLRVGSLLSMVFPEFSALFPKLASPSALAVLQAATSPGEILALGVDRLAGILRAASRGKLGRNRARQLVTLATSSVGTASAALTQALRLILDQVRLLCEQITTLEEQIAQLYKTADVPLESLPGTGPVLAATCFSEIGSLNRFSRASQIVAFSGIDPKLRQSGAFVGQVRMSKRGSPHLRRAVYLACQSAVRTDPYFKAIYERQLQRGKPKRKALGAVMNRFIHVLYAVWRDNRAYSPLTPA